jgi:hypothetical protein
MIMAYVAICYVNKTAVTQSRGCCTNPVRSFLLNETVRVKPNHLLCLYHCVGFSNSIDQARAEFFPCYLTGNRLKEAFLDAIDRQCPQDRLDELA